VITTGADQAAMRLAAAASPADKVNRLLSDSPFGAARAGTTAGKIPEEALEFRAVLEENGARIFSIFEAKTQRSTWIELQHPVNGLTVESYDDRKEIVQVEYQGKHLTLPIRQASGLSAATSVPLPATRTIVSAARPPQPAEGGPALTPKEQADEKAIAAEVERYKKRAELAAAARERAIRAQSVAVSN